MASSVYTSTGELQLAGSSVPTSSVLRAVSVPSGLFAAADGEADAPPLELLPQAASRLPAAVADTPRIAARCRNCRRVS